MGFSPNSEAYCRIVLLMFSRMIVGAKPVDSGVGGTCSDVVTCGGGGFIRAAAVSASGNTNAGLLSWDPESDVVSASFEVRG